MTVQLDLTTDEILATTRNVRKRLDLARPVDRAVVEECLNLALQAPNGSNNQGWEWIAVDDPGTRSAIAELQREALDMLLAQWDEVADRVNVGRNERMEQISGSVSHLMDHMQDIPVLMVPAMLTPGRLEHANSFYQASAWGSILQAVWSFMLALRSRGLGSAWTTLQLLKERETAELLGIPYDSYTIAGVFPVAYTIGTDFKPAQRRPAHEVLHWNQW